MKNFLPLLCSTSLFNGLTPEELQTLLAQLGAVMRSYGKGEALVLAGEPNRRVGIVLSGELEAYRPGPQGARIPITHMEPGGVFGDVSEKKDARRVAVRCMKECIDVGRAAGATFAPVQGKDITKLFYYKNGFKRAIAELLVPIAMKKHRAIEPSMLQDLKKGKPCEIDAINGVVCEWGRRCGVPTPINDRIVEIVKKEQAGELPLEEKNIRFFDDLL